MILFFQHELSYMENMSRSLILDNRSQISVITRKQTPSLQSNSQASLDLWNPTMGKFIELKSRDTRAIPVKSATHNNRCSMVYA
jgi:hypothetical protein